MIEAELAVQQVRDLDRRLIRKRALERFSPTRMAEEYEAIYRQVIAERARTDTGLNRTETAVPAVGFGHERHHPRSGPDAASDRLDGVSPDLAASAPDRRQRDDPHRHRVWTDPTMTAAGVFYPEGADSAERLNYYASRFPVVEVDATYYALPVRRTAELWVEHAAGLRLDIKAHA